MENTISQRERLLVNAIDVEQEYKVIGLDLTKHDTSCVCIAEQPSPHTHYFRHGAM